jgi:Zn-dependent M28 family amino/carboxypeptidase
MYVSDRRNMMPYIKQEDRSKFEILIADAQMIENCGELNYVISKICLQYLKTKGMKYQNINDIMGALYGVQHELYRRVYANYEDQKVIENGDIL